jgi:hypothetical protein
MADSLNFNSGIFNSPPIPPIPIFDEKGNIIYSIKETNQDSILNWKKVLNSISEKTTKNYTIAVETRINNIIELNDEKFKPEKINDNGYKLNLELIDYKPNITFIAKTGSRKNSEYLENKQNKDVFGVISFSRINFDEQRENAVLAVDVFCGRLCCAGYLVYLKRVNNSWKIVKTIQTTVC